MKRLTCKTCEFKGTLGKLIKHYEKEPSHRPTGIRVVEGKKEEEGPLVAVRSFYATLATTVERQEEIVTDLTERANTAERELHRLREVHQALSVLFEGSEEFRGKVAS